MHPAAADLTAFDLPVLDVDTAVAFFREPAMSWRFWEKVIPEPNTGCMLWLGALNDDGYACFWFFGEQVYAHRLTFIAFFGPPGPGLELDHWCRTRCCVNPFHLRAVTHAANMRRVVPAARDASRRTS